MDFIGWRLPRISFKHSLIMINPQLQHWLFFPVLVIILLIFVHQVPGMSAPPPTVPTMPDRVVIYPDATNNTPVPPQEQPLQQQQAPVRNQQICSRSATDLFYEKQTSYRPFYRLQSLFSVCSRRIAFIVCKDVFLQTRNRWKTDLHMICEVCRVCKPS